VRVVHHIHMRGMVVRWCYVCVGCIYLGDIAVIVCVICMCDGPVHDVVIGVHRRLSIMHKEVLKIDDLIDVLLSHCIVNTH